jgi:hypothetical protein
VVEGSGFREETAIFVKSVTEGGAADKVRLFAINLMSLYSECVVVLQNSLTEDFTNNF